MHIEQLRTFLVVAATGNFNKAALRLNITQSTVSARIRTLEERLGQSVFERKPGGIDLTHAGRRLQRHALNILRLWQRAEQEVALPGLYESSLGLGTVMSLMDFLVLPWVPWMRRARPDVALHIHSDFSGDLMGQLIDGVLDLAVMYEPRQTPGLAIVELLTDELVLWTSDPAGDWRERYVYVDWGEPFRLSHEQALAEITPSIFFGLGPLALGYVLAEGGSGYFPARSVAKLESQGRLHRVPGAPVMRRTGYVVYSKAAEESELLQLALQGLKAVLEAEAAVRGR